MSTERSGLGGWIALFFLLAYAFFVHQGMAAPRIDGPGLWWDPTKPFAYFITLPYWGQIETTLGLEDAEYRQTWFIHALVISIPSFLLAAGVIAWTRSSVARAIAFTCVLSIILFVFFGFVMDGIWKAFHWRVSAIIVSISAAIGFALASPWLAASWLRLPWIARLVLYLPFFAFIVILCRHTTGWDPSMAGNFSPWPALPAIGLGMGVVAIVGFLLGIAVTVNGVANLKQNALVGVIEIGAGLALPVWWFWFSFSLGGAQLVGVLVVGLVISGLSLVTQSPDRNAALLRRSGHIALGALLVYLPLFVGRAMTEADYNQSRFVIAQEVIDALHQHYLAEQLYPDSLDTLVEKNLLDEIPQPRVGFQAFYDLGWMDPEPYSFDYRGFGTSYVLEFVSTEWIQCAYNPPYLDEYGNEYEEYEDEDGEESGGDIWTCSTSRPQFF